MRHAVHGERYAFLFQMFFGALAIEFQLLIFLGVLCVLCVLCG
jgi:hypothetical protein